MRHGRKPLAVRAGLLTFRAARMGLLLAAVPALLVLAVWLCFASTPTP
ncbi:hypothetical protein [Streptomyces iranensis]|uniref:Uncharacterized protein n=1 Tax=Streptomyces iranensis TaxID=576784 RepID=A0A060ZVU7_9ACTN|nr:hypothetical protein [Streptomyces iranensis]MBP2064844.1 hypothetical protein [Streptomyces iranensis]CDR10220.1 predicted protein [Streptomyces iranensis]